MKTDKLLSIIVASYNVEKYITKAIDCYSQLLSDKEIYNKLEIIIINDGSKDKTQEIAVQFESDFPNAVRVINKENGGHGSCINTGIKEATGKYFFLVDADDWVNIEGLKELLHLLEKNDNDIICTKKREVNMMTENTLLIPLPKHMLTNQTFNLQELQYNKLIVAYLSLHTCCFKTSILKKNHITVLEHCFYVDYEFISKACTYCSSIIFYDLEVYQYLIGNPNQSVNSKKLAERYKQQEKVINSIILFYNKLSANQLSHLIEYKISALIRYYFKILLLLFDDRKSGKKLASDYAKQLKKDYNNFWKSTRKRYYLLKVLQVLNLNGDFIFNIKKRIPNLYNKIFNLFR